ncbi:MAG: TOBE domain-containing protein [Burkholderiaceae bacterium]|nr:TOBE domain-containing protein [Burkholderiaceae bacterium]
MNRLRGEISAIESCGSVALVDVRVGERRYAATLLGAGGKAASWRPGQAISLLFNETEVALAKNLTGLISLRNRLPGTVTAVERGQVLSRVCFDVDGIEVAAVITSRSLDMLALAIGDRVEGLVKANEMHVVEDVAP